jgi:hypothetical protein
MLKSYVVRAGDHLAKIAHRAGLDPDAVWGHAKNAPLRAKRPDRNLLAEGDVLFLPIEEEKPLPLRIGQENRFSVVIPEVETHVRLANAKGPFANEPYVVEGLDEPVKGTTDADGGLTISAPVTVRSAKVTLEKRGLTFNVLVGDMDPISEVSGIQLRLISLGFLTGGASGQLDEATLAALRSFQKEQGLEASGRVDDGTLDALKTAYGC